MTITTEEAEWLAKQHDLVRFTLGMKAPEHDLTAATIRSLAAERDALQARVAEWAELVAYLCGRNTDHIQVALAGNPIVVDALVKRAEAALEGEKDE